MHTQSQTQVNMLWFSLSSTQILFYCFLGYGTVMIKFETNESQHIFIYMLWFTFILS